MGDTPHRAALPPGRTPALDSRTSLEACTAKSPEEGLDTAPGVPARMAPSREAEMAGVLTKVVEGERRPEAQAVPWGAPLPPGVTGKSVVAGSQPPTRSLALPRMRPYLTLTPPSPCRHM